MISCDFPITQDPDAAAELEGPLPLPPPAEAPPGDPAAWRSQRMYRAVWA